VIWLLTLFKQGSLFQNAGRGEGGNAAQLSLYENQGKAWYGRKWARSLGLMEHLVICTFGTDAGQCRAEGVIFLFPRLN